MYADRDYIIGLRREIHMYPEVGFDLSNTIAIVKRELDSMGIVFTEKYGKSSVVATINPEKEGFTIGIRADMDALLIEEKNDVEYCFPDISYCTDNASMIAAAGYFLYKKGEFVTLDLNAESTINLK